MQKTFTQLTGCVLFILFMGLNFTTLAQNQSGPKIPLTDAISIIEKRFKTQFAYEHSLLQGKTTEKTSLKGRSVEEILKNVLYPNNLIFLYVSENSYSIVSRKASFFNGTGTDNTIEATTTANNTEQRTLRGTVTDQLGQALSYTSLWVKGTSQGTQTNDRGGYILTSIKPTDIIVFSIVGYNTLEIAAGEQRNLDVVLSANPKMLQEVEVISNGYQKISRERSTGSAALITSADIEKYPSPNILQRLEGIVPGVQFNISAGDRSFTYQSGAASGTGLSAQGSRSVGINDYTVNIRGTGTLQGESFPLIVVDGAITEIDLASINPNDIDNITFLKDAAAASIWGVRAANGVIVVNTKKGKRRDSPNLNFSTNFMIAGEPDLSYLRTMNAAQQLGYEKELVDRNFTPAVTGNSYYTATSVYSPGTYLAQQLKAGTITEDAYNSQVAQLSAIDNRSQISEYLLQKASSQQYNLSVDGGNEYSSYFYSGSYSKEQPNIVGNSGERMTATVNNSWTFFKKITLSTNLKGTFFKYKNRGISTTELYKGSRNTLMPYQLLADANGKGISYDRLDPAYTSTLPSVYKNWKYNYLDELANADNVQKDNNFLANINLRIPIIEGLSASGSYNIERTFSTARSYFNQDTFTFRDLVNYYTYPDGSSNSLGITNGGILRTNNTDQNNHSLRGQLDLDRVFYTKHRITALAGTEIRETNIGQATGTSFGYNPQTGFTNSGINFSSTPTYAYIGGYSPDSFTPFISGGYPEQLDKKRRFLSYYGNAAYTYDDKYVVSGSVRYDDYNNFGLDRKYRATPLWSTGLKWNASRETFMKDVSWVSNVALRASYGVNGNLSLSTSPYTAIAVTGSDGVTGLPAAFISAIANPELRWEKTYETNIGIDFSLLDNRINGTFDLYKKNSKDLLFSFPLSSVYVGTIGNGELTRNTASMTGKGLDAALSGAILNKKDFGLNVGLTFSYNTNAIGDTRFSESLYNSSFGTYPMGVRYVSGYATDKLLVYRNAGLDANGLTQIFDKDNNIVSASTASLSNFADLKYAGRTTAPYYGAITPSFRYKQFTLMAQMTYQFGSVFLKPTIQGYITSTRQVNYDLSAAIAQRWQKPGDELTTNVPGLNGNGSTIYTSLARFQNSDINVLKGDYLRLRQLSLTYQIPAAILNRFSIKSANAGFGVNNLGLLWTANKEGYDPDFTNYVSSPRGLPAATSYNLSLSLNF